MKIPIYKLEFDSDFTLKYQKGVKSILNSKSISEGNFVKKFEKNYAKFIKSNYSLAVSSGTAALEIAFRAVNPSCKKIIIPTNTFFGTAAAVTRSNSPIELCDIENDTFGICPFELEKKINKNTGAVCIVHVGGIISSYVKEIIEICNFYNVPLIEDAAHAHGSYYKNYRAGTIGDIGCFSFFPTKVMTTGEGGMITTNNLKYYYVMKSLKNFGRNNKDIKFQINDGNNYKMSEFQGLMGYLDLKRVKKRILRRKKLATIYQEYLKKNKIFNCSYQKKGVTSYYKQIIKTRINNSILREYFNKYDITLTSEVWKYPIHVQPFYKKKFINKKFSCADNFSNYHICPPLYPELKFKEVDYILNIFDKASFELTKKISK